MQAGLWKLTVDTRVIVEFFWIDSVNKRFQIAECDVDSGRRV